MSFPKKTRRYKKLHISYKIVRASVIERDSAQCQLRAKGCEGVSGPPHHIILKSALGADISQNLICLCPSCHRLVHTDTDKFTPILLQLQEKHYGKLNKLDLKRRKQNG